MTAAIERPSAAPRDRRSGEGQNGLTQIDMARRALS
jgi:hypothetical protein